MASNLSPFENLRTTEEVINALSTLYFNLNEIERIYYDLFINTTPKDVTLQRYSEIGSLETITIPNRAKDRQDIISGSGSPIGAIAANVGTFYLDTSSPYNLYYKASGTDSSGWVVLRSSVNFTENTDYLAPNGDGSRLTGINASNLAGVLSVSHGGTGVTSISGLIKGNGTGAFTSAVPGKDYLVGGSFCGLICFYPVSEIPEGWLLCNGATYLRTDYPDLFDVIGTTYGSTVSTNFKVPNLLNYFIRCWDGVSAVGTIQEDTVKAHNHTFSGETALESGHTHTRGTMNITGTLHLTQEKETFGDPKNYYTGAFYLDKRGGNGVDGTHGSFDIVNFDASRSWSGTTSSGSAHLHTFSGTTENNGEATETRPISTMLVPMIKY